MCSWISQKSCRYAAMFPILFVDASFISFYGLCPEVEVVAKLVSCKTLLVILMPG